VDLNDLQRRAANYVDRATTDEVRVGPSISRPPKALGLTMPQSLLATADKVIE
jgi:hypothetical protein